LTEFTSVYSYADRRWSDGNLYYKLGFNLDGISPPDYFYIFDKKRKHRWAFRKDVLKNKKDFIYDPAKTEYQNMLGNGFDRVWDCGSLRFVKKIR
jgi:hypothetical protein